MSMHDTPPTHIVVSVRDVKVGEYLSLVLAKNVDDAQRHFLGMVREPRSPLYSFPRDYQLHIFGTFNAESGTIYPESKNRDITPYNSVEAAILDNETRKTNLDSLRARVETLERELRAALTK